MKRRSNGQVLSEGQCGEDNHQFKHGMFGTKPYQVWADMKRRCYNENSSGYKRYGGRGIKVCDRWNDNFENFWEDMGTGYLEGLILDRVDNDGNYTPQNCRWVTPLISSRNKSNTLRIVTLSRGVIPIVEAAQHFGINYHWLWRRIKKQKDFILCL